MKIKLSTFPERDILFEKSFEANEEFFITIVDENGKTVYQGNYTTSGLKLELSHWARV